jgi:tRNA uridine 5-carboxymethylaminomethyl modification enzyme
VAQAKLEILVKFEGYVKRQCDSVKDFDELEKMKIDSRFEYQNLAGLSTEVKDKLSKIKPVTLGQAIRIPGVTPAAIAAVMVQLKKFKAEVCAEN